MLRFRT